MKKHILLGAVLLTMSASLVFAEATNEEAKLEALRKLTEAKKIEINGSQWDVQIKAMDGKGSLPEKDALTFQDGTFSSKYFSEKGFSPTNYTLTVEREDGPTVWETMQTSEKGGVVFWRGEWKDEAMSGIISRQLEKGNEEYSFTSSGKQSISPTSTEEKSEEKVENPIEEQPPKEKAPAKKNSKKKGWFTLDSKN